MLVARRRRKPIAKRYPCAPAYAVFATLVMFSKCMRVEKRKKNRKENNMVRKVSAIGGEMLLVQKS